MTTNNELPQHTESPKSGVFNMRVGKTTYVIDIHFSSTAEDTLEDKMKRLIREEIIAEAF